MAINPEHEELLTLAEASHVIPTRPDVRTIWRWLERGCRGVRLDSIRIGGRRYTSREAIERFLGTLNDERQEDPPATRRTRRIRRAQAELAEHGL